MVDLSKQTKNFIQGDGACRWRTIRVSSRDEWSRREKYKKDASERNRGIFREESQGNILLKQGPSEIKWWRSGMAATTRQDEFAVRTEAIATYSDLEADATWG
ncbi:hypothetical protein B0H14DRAFT_2560556 [Mycena olivaceomarginata]|nr:hypothetical protein B0H14DRAFT_2560556 [Mycena olivaceomarginata]